MLILNLAIILSSSNCFGFVMKPFSMKRFSLQKNTPNEICSNSQNFLKYPLYVSPGNVDTEVEKKNTGVPDKQQFLDYYNKVVQRGSEMSLDQLKSYPLIGALLASSLVYDDDINDIWMHATGDAKGLNADEAYEAICMISTVPDPEDIEYLDNAFEKLSVKGKLNYFKLLNWDDIQDMINEEALTMEEITDIYRSVAGDLNTAISLSQFRKLNVLLDEAIEEKESNGQKKVKYDDEDLTDVNVWDTKFNPRTIFDDESYNELETFFNDNCDQNKMIFFESIVNWDEIDGFLSEGILTKDALNKVWKEASQGKDKIDFDTFLRFNVRLESVMDEIESSKESKTSASSDDGDVDDSEKFYRTEFKKITRGNRLLRLDMLLGWKDIRDLVDEGAIKEAQIERMFESMPKEPMGLPATAYGITEDTFVAFNGMLDIMLDSGAGSSSSTSVKNTAAPVALVSEPKRALPADAELKFGSLPESINSEATTGLTEAELDMMKILDNADNMLMSGSYSDFDRLIGDVNDPRLQALRQKRDGAEEVVGDLKSLKAEILKLAGNQLQSGLGKFDENDAGRLRDLVQGIVERSAKISDEPIEVITTRLLGQWKLLYSNSEMFRFYNGITGFVNILPGSKFESLTVQYVSDGYLTEAKYIEKFTTPLGIVDAVVDASWNMVKEMSFMTNENSVVLRGYCKKVKAGPMEYEAEENWKSLRTMAMNEILYIDDELMLIRNCGALRVFFVFQRI